MLFDTASARLNSAVPGVPALTVGWPRHGAHSWALLCFNLFWSAGINEVLRPVVAQWASASAGGSLPGWEQLAVPIFKYAGGVVLLASSREEL